MLIVCAQLIIVVFCLCWTKQLFLSLFCLQVHQVGFVSEERPIHVTLILSTEETLLLTVLGVFKDPYNFPPYFVLKACKFSPTQNTANSMAKSYRQLFNCRTNIPYASLEVLSDKLSKLENLEETISSARKR